MPRLSIIIPVYNGAASIGRCLQSLCRSSFIDREIIVVDDGSCDASAAIARQYPCILITLPENRGAAYARNTGARHASGDILLFVDADMIAKEDTIEKLMAVFTADKTVQAAGSVLTKETLRQDWGRVLVALMDRYYLETWGENERFRVSTCFRSNCGALYKAVFFQVGGFDERYAGAGIEEYDFGRRLSSVSEFRLYKNVEMFHDNGGILERGRKLFRRCFPYIPYLLYYRKIEVNDAIINIRHIVTTILLAAAMLLFPLLLLFSFLWQGILLLAVLILFLNIRFFWFIFKEKGLLFLLYSIPMFYVLFSFVAAGMLLAFLRQSASLLRVHRREQHA